MTTNAHKEFDEIVSLQNFAMNYFDVKEETKELIYERRAKNVDSLVCRDIMLSIIVPAYNTEKYLAKMFRFYYTSIREGRDQNRSISY